MDAQEQGTNIQVLEHERAAFNAFVAQHVDASLALSPDDHDQLTHAEIALRLADKSLRREYIRRAIALLEANIRYYSSEAIPSTPAERTVVTPVVTSLLAAAAGYYVQGPVLALVLAAAGYWLGYNHAFSPIKQHAKEAASHNAETAEWKSTLADWHRSVVELRGLDT